jgi:alpha-amylase
MAVLMSDGPAGNKWMEVGKPGARFVDVTGHVGELVVANEHGWGEFRCNEGSVSVWVQEQGSPPVEGIADPAYPGPARG